MKTSIKIIPVIFSFAILITAFSSEKPVLKEKKTAEKKVVVKTAKQTDYLNDIMPKSINNVTNGKMDYKKDSKGVYQLVPKEGC